MLHKFWHFNHLPRYLLDSPYVPSRVSAGYITMCIVAVSDQKLCVGNGKGSQFLRWKTEILQKNFTFILFLICRWIEHIFASDWVVFMLQYINNVLFQNWNLMLIPFKIYHNKLFRCILMDFLHILYFTMLLQFFVFNVTF